jgi:hypothetical protein
LPRLAALLSSECQTATKILAIASYYLQADGKLTNSAGVETISNTGDDATNNEMRNAVGTGLKRSTDTEDNTSSQDTFASTELFAEK